MLFADNAFFHQKRLSKAEKPIQRVIVSPNIDELVKRPIQHFFERQSKKLHRQGARNLRNEAYLWYAAVTREEGERSIWAFYEAVNINSLTWSDPGSLRLPRERLYPFRVIDPVEADPDPFISFLQDRGRLDSRGFRRTCRTRTGPVSS